MTDPTFRQKMRDQSGRARDRVERDERRRAEREQLRDAPAPPSLGRRLAHAWAKLRHQRRVNP